MLVFKSSLSELSRDKLKSFQGSEKALNILLDSKKRYWSYKFESHNHKNESKRT